MLNKKEYWSIRDLFLNTKKHISTYYEDIYTALACEPENALLGGYTLLESYIEPIIDSKEAGNADIEVRKYLEEWVDSPESITVICGEPGHGKTSLCKKAVYDFYKKGWLTNKVDNVFFFSLNPTGTNLDLNDFSINHLLSWGEGDIRREQTLKISDCRNALVFFDAFDELLEADPKYKYNPDDLFDLEGFIQKSVIDFQKVTKAHIVITTRRMSLEKEDKSINVSHNGDTMNVSIKRLQLVPKEKQFEWIQKCHCSISQESMGKSNALDSRVINMDYLAEYKKFYNILSDSDELRRIIGIPIIFRMIVANSFIPTNEVSIIDVYDTLFTRTLERHKGLKNEKEIRSRLSKHALKIYFDNEDTAEVAEEFGLAESAWIYSFYTRRSNSIGEKNSKRVGFLHRSFYQYFLSKEIINWFIDTSLDDTSFKNALSNLYVRRLNKTTLTYIYKIYEKTSEDLKKNARFERAFEILKETDGIHELLCTNDVTIEGNVKTDSIPTARFIGKVNPLQRANNIFWNVLSICCICKHPLTQENINVSNLSIYNLSGCYMAGAELSGTKLWSANFSKVNLYGAKFCNSELPRAYLRNAELTKTDFSSANLRGASLRYAILNNANLLRADLTGADLRSADLSRADLRCVIIDNAILERTKFDSARINKSDIDMWKNLNVDTSNMDVVSDTEE